MTKSVDQICDEMREWYIEKIHDRVSWFDKVKPNVHMFLRKYCPEMTQEEKKHIWWMTEWMKKVILSTVIYKVWNRRKKKK